MSKLASRNAAITAIAIVAPLVLLTASVGLFSRVSAGSLRDSHSQLKTQLTSQRGEDFNRALSSLVDLDEQGTLDLWDAALTNSSPELRLRAWNKYRPLQPKLVRNQLVPQIARIRAG